MRLVIALAFFCLSMIASANAATYVFTGQDSSNIKIEGRYTGPSDDWAFLLTPGISFIGPNVGPSNPYESYDQFIGYQLNVYANGSLIFFACGSNQGADCGYRYIHPNPSIWISSYFGGAFEITASFSETHTSDPYRLEISFGDQDGYVLAAVPEPSTWAMLLIGFAGIGFVSYRKRQKAQYVR